MHTIHCQANDVEIDAQSASCSFQMLKVIQLCGLTSLMDTDSLQ